MSDASQDEAVELAWAAGLFEGEGCIYSHQNKKDRWSYPGLRVASTDLDVLERFAAAVGEGNVTGPVKNNQEGRKPYWQWQVSASGADRILRMEAFRSHLGERRKAKAAEVLDRCERQRREAGPAKHMKTCPHCGHPGRFYLDEPVGYVAWHEWAERMSRVYDQRPCPGCDRLTVWRLKPGFKKAPWNI